MANLAIKGHETRGKEVIEILEMLGGTNRENCWGVFKHRLYLINDSGDIEDISLKDNSNYRIYTLEEFLKEFPYKVGDKVRFSDSNTPFTISRIWWDNNASELICTLEEQDIDVSSVDLQPYKEETMEERKYSELRMPLDDDDKLATEATIDGNKITPPKNYLIGKITKMDNGMLVEFVEKQPKYPNTYEECCNVLGCDKNLVLGTMPMKYKVLINLQKLLICRDAYWKIAGEELGLDKPWKPEYVEGVVNTYYTIHLFNNKLFLAGTSHRNSILSFSTEEMRDAFYGNFKNLIEQCKELL